MTEDKVRPLLTGKLASILKQLAKNNRRSLSAQLEEVLYGIWGENLENLPEGIYLESEDEN